MRVGKCYFFDIFKKECSALTKKATPEQCERCKFFKTAEDFDAGIAAADERLHDMGLVRVKKNINGTLIISTEKVGALYDDE